ncbi:MAG: urea ABC transporter permease subunit UrtB [Rhizobiaceae bacterium]|nr:urea ABC transporter permease subunit UrtB [Rhizobiaceae bacterium]
MSVMLAVMSLSATTAQEADAFRQVLSDNYKLIQRSSTKTVSPVLEAIQNTNFQGAAEFLDKWQEKELWFRKSDNAFVYVETDDKKTYRLLDVVDGTGLGEVPKKEIKQIKPNSGVRGLLAARLVQFQLTDPDVEVRRKSLESINRDPKLEHLEALRIAIEKETDAGLLAEFARIERILTIKFDEDPAARIEALNSFSGALSIDVRASLNLLLTTKLAVAKTLPEDINIARVIVPDQTGVNPDGSAFRLHGLLDMGGDQTELTRDAAYDMLVKANLAPATIDPAARKEILIANIEDGKIGKLNVSELDSDEARDSAYSDLVLLGKAEAFLTEDEQDQLISEHIFYASYVETNQEVTDVAREVLNDINASVTLNQFFDLALDGISLASIYFLAAIGLAITFGVMRVINMAHGEFIMMGAYSGYVVQQIVPNYTISIIIGIPVAFMVTFAAGVLMERLVIRHLYNRPLETLLATFGISIALQQLAKNIFGTQARPLTAPDWLDGAWVINDVVSISWIRIAIFVLGILFFCMILFVLNKTRLGLETRAVTQNPRMAASMGIDPDKINMLTFGLGCGIAGIAGVAIGLFAKVTSELGNDYIVQSFMTVVVGGVGNIWGTLAGATMIGFLQKIIEYFNPSNTLAAQTYMIIFIIIFIQFRPRGLIALKGRAAEA